MNLTHWANGAWANGTWVPASWGTATPTPTPSAGAGGLIYSRREFDKSYEHIEHIELKKKKRRNLAILLMMDGL